MEREQIIKALECCIKVCKHRDVKFCGICPLRKEKCTLELPKKSLALINELIEENKAKDETISKLIEGIQAGTVLKIGFDDVARLIYGETEYFIIGNPFIDLIKKAMLEENENGQREND